MTSTVQNVSGYKPTKSIIKEAVFNILRSSSMVLEKSNFLDVCAGTGACSLEALSNGINAVTMIEMEKKAYSQILTNVARFTKIYVEFSNSIEVIKNDFRNIIPHLKQMYDILYFDPPYEVSISNVEHISRLLTRFNIMKEGGMIFYEVPSKDALNVVKILTESHKQMYNVKQKKYGDTTLIYMIYRSNMLN